MKKAIATDKAPKAIGPYSQGVVSGRFVFVSGQIPLDPATGQLSAGDIKVQTELVIKNIQSVLRSQGFDLSHVVKTTVFLKNLGDFQAMNEVYGRFFKEPFPARSTIQVSELPKGVPVEIEAIASLD